MIEIFLDSYPVQATGMIPGQEIVIHFKEEIFYLRRLGTEIACVEVLLDKKKGKEK
jgi:hypothetical protein